MKTYRYLIIGNSAAGIGAAEAIRETDSRGSLAIVSDEAANTYSRALIAYYLAGEVGRERLNYRPADFYQRLGATAWLGRRAERVDFAAQRVSVTAATQRDGEEIAYERLLIATGGRAIRPPLPGIGLEGVATFQSLADVEAVRSGLDAVRRAVVIGGGLIGMQAAEALVKLGREVVVIELLDRVLAPVLDATGSAAVERRFAERGVQIRTGTAVTAILSDPRRPSRAAGVSLATGEEIQADLVIVAVGVAPRTELVADSPVRVGKGIIVNGKGETSRPGVWAAGDVVESYDLISGALRPLPIWPKAYAGGRVAGFNMAGRTAERKGDVAINASHFFGFPVVSAGLHSPPPGEESAYEVLVEHRPEDGYYKKMLLRDGVIVGLVGTGPAVDRVGILLGLLRERVDVGSFKDQIFHRTGLVSLPHPLRQRRLQGR